jgi:hypothetical protein
VNGLETWFLNECQNMASKITPYDIDAFFSTLQTALILGALVYFDLTLERRIAKTFNIGEKAVNRRPKFFKKPIEFLRRFIYKKVFSHIVKDVDEALFLKEARDASSIIRLKLYCFDECMGCRDNISGAENRYISCKELIELCNRTVELLFVVEDLRRFFGLLEVADYGVEPGEFISKEEINSHSLLVNRFVVDMLNFLIKMSPCNKNTDNGDSGVDDMDNDALKHSKNVHEDNNKENQRKSK